MSPTVKVEGVGDVELSYTERGSGRPVVVLHGGAGPASVVPWAEHLAKTHGARVIVPTHPGFMGTPRPERVATFGAVARSYAALLDTLDLKDVVLIGNSVGGQIASELALLSRPRLRGLVLVDATGIDVPGHPVADIFTLPFDEIRRRSYHDPSKFVIDPTKLPPAAQAAMASNVAALKTYAGNRSDPPLLPRLSKIDVPTLVVWGESDRVVDPEYGRAYANAIPGARFQLIPRSGHLPQMETPAELTATVWEFVEGSGKPRPA